MIRRSWLAGCLALCAWSAIAASAAEKPPDPWFEAGRREVAERKRLVPGAARARNVILFVGDGMGLSTVTAARILEGQQRGGTGEEHRLYFERFPYVALSKTYTVNQQVAESAATATALLTGVKTRSGMLGLGQGARRGDAASAAGNVATTLIERAEKHGLATGIVTTTRLTHATPGAAYAHVPERDWESDADLPPEAVAAGIKDVARQLVEFGHGDGLEVALGGGRARFLSRGVTDPEDEHRHGARRDGRDLVAEWVARRPRSAYVWNLKGFDAVDPAGTDHLLGLFDASHMAYEVDRAGDAGGEPALSEMTRKALAILSRNRKGFVLLVEGGSIDHAHHLNDAWRALTETIELARAVEVAHSMTDPATTLIVVTADHGSPLTIAGYPTRGNDILGKVVGNDDHGLREPDFAGDSLGLPFTTLGYANGPGYTGASDEQPEGSKAFRHDGKGYRGIAAGRPDLRARDTRAPAYLQEATVPLYEASHSGEDVPVYATGPGAHLVGGVIEQHVIYHVLAEALGLD